MTSSSRVRYWRLRLATFSVFWLLIYQKYEPEVWKELSGFGGELAIDIGANFGQYTIRFARKFKRVLAVEPRPNNARILRGNVRRCRCHNVEIFQCAIADYDGEARLKADPMWPANASLTFGPLGEQLRVVRLDKLLENETSIDLLKVDVEGLEWQVFRSATSIMPAIRRWLIELHDVSRTNEFDSILRSSGYETKWIMHPKRLPHVLADNRTERDAHENPT